MFTIRTLDLGGDKLPAFLSPHYEPNPHLGLRGLRFSLAERAMFETQLRAILAASTEHENIRILFPMVLGPSDLNRALQFVRDVARQIGVRRMPPLGAMIETPAALFALEDIVGTVDFVSIGTNDLTQFILAVDRNEAELIEDCTVHHPAVIRAIARVVSACREANREVCVCGEAAGDPTTAGLLVGLGVSQLSMSPMRAARVRYTLRGTSSHSLQQIAERALRSDSPQNVQRLLKDLRAG